MKTISVDKNNIEHFYDDCSAIVGKIKTKRADHLYNICPTCSARHSQDVHETYTDLVKHRKSNILEFANNVQKSDDLTPEKKAEAIKFGTLQILMLENMYRILDNLNIGADK